MAVAIDDPFSPDTPTQVPPTTPNPVDQTNKNDPLSPASQNVGIYPIDPTLSDGGASTGAAFPGGTPAPDPDPSINYRDDVPTGLGRAIFSGIDNMVLGGIKSSFTSAQALVSGVGLPMLYQSEAENGSLADLTNSDPQVRQQRSRL